jgi:hypothetical protein
MSTEVAERPATLLGLSDEGLIEILDHLVCPNGFVIFSDHWDGKAWRPKLLIHGGPHSVAVLRACRRLLDIGRERLYRFIRFYTRDHQDLYQGSTLRSLWFHKIGSLNISFLTRIQLFLTIIGKDWKFSVHKWQSNGHNRRLVKLVDHTKRELNTFTTLAVLASRLKHMEITFRVYGIFRDTYLVSLATMLQSIGLITQLKSLHVSVVDGPLPELAMQYLHCKIDATVEHNGLYALPCDLKIIICKAWNDLIESEQIIQQEFSNVFQPLNADFGDEGIDEPGASIRHSTTCTLV